MILFLVCWLITSPVATPQLIGDDLFAAADGPVLLSNASSTEVVNVTGVQVRLECFAACRLRGCLLASHVASSRLCQLLLVNDASRGLGPSGTHVQRLLGSEQDARLWTTSGFIQLVISRMLNVTVSLGNSSTGRLGSIQYVAVPYTGCYRIEVWGAAGGTYPSTSMAGGRCAFKSGAFNLTAGTQLSVVVGQAGGRSKTSFAGGGGGGGSFVYRTADQVLLVAAGGGGSGAYSETGLPGESGVNGTDRLHSYGDPISYGGINGEPGFNNPSAMPTTHNHAGCGAGWLGQPVNPRRGPNDGDRGGGRAEGWVGGLAGGSNGGDGGFGGGGGGGARSGVYGAPGAGGGFSGGGVGYIIGACGGSGGSFCSGLKCGGETGGNTGEHGRVVLRLLAPLANSCEKI